MNPKILPPAPEEFELSVFGPGYGEAIVVHLGHGKWMLVDSCKEPITRKPAALWYLGQIGVDVATNVQLVVATHWDDDHSRGLKEVVRSCSAATIYTSAAIQNEELLTMARVFNAAYEDMYSGLSELFGVFQFLSARKSEGVAPNKLKRASADSVLVDKVVEYGSSASATKVYALSPSDESIEHTQLRNLSWLTEDKKYALRVPRVSPNDASVVLWVQVGTVVVLLGADLERTSNPLTGWLAVLDHRNIRLERADAFKVAHHGAASGHEPRIWTELLQINPLALIIPFRRGNKILPTADDVERIAALTSKAYITSGAVGSYRWSDHVVKQKVNIVTKTMTNLVGGWGHIRLRKSIVDSTDTWGVALFGEARAISPS